MIVEELKGVDVRQELFAYDEGEVDVDGLRVVIKRRGLTQDGESSGDGRYREDPEEKTV